MQILYSSGAQVKVRMVNFCGRFLTPIDCVVLGTSQLPCPLTLCKLELVTVIHSIGVNISLQEHNGVCMQIRVGPYENRSGYICNVSQHVYSLFCQVKVTFLCE